MDTTTKVKKLTIFHIYCAIDIEAIFVAKEYHVLTIGFIQSGQKCANLTIDCRQNSRAKKAGRGLATIILGAQVDQNGVYPTCSTPCRSNGTKNCVAIDLSSTHVPSLRSRTSNSHVAFPR